MVKWASHSLIEVEHAWNFRLGGADEKVRSSRECQLSETAVVLDKQLPSALNTHKKRKGVGLGEST